MPSINFIEVESVEEANKVDLKVYSFLGLKKDLYCFKKRTRK